MAAGDGAHRVDARFGDFTEVFRRVTAIDVAPGEIHHGFRSIQIFYPLADMFAIPLHFLDLVIFVAFAQLARQNDDFVIALEQFLGERLTQEPAAARQHDAFFVHVQILTVRQFQCQFWRVSAGERILFKMRSFQASEPVSDQPAYGGDIQTLVLARIFFEIGQRELEQRGGGMRTVFLQMHKRAGQLNQPLVKRAVGPVFVLEPQMFQHFVRLEKKLPVEAIEIAEVMRRRAFRPRTAPTILAMRALLWLTGKVKVQSPKSKVQSRSKVSCVSR